MSPLALKTQRFGQSLFARAIVSILFVLSVVVPTATPLVVSAQNTANPALPPSQPPRSIFSGCDITFTRLAGTVTGIGSPIAFSTCFASIFYFLFIYLTSILAGWAGYFFDITSAISLAGQTYSNQFINSGWTLARDLANMAFVFLLIYLAFLLILDLAHSGVAKQLAKIIGVALLINFSFFFSRVVIDASNILSHAFYDAIRGQTIPNLRIEKFPANSSSAIEVKSISANILAGINVQRLFYDQGSNESTFSKFQKEIEKANGWVNFALLVTVFVVMGIMNIILVFAFLTAAVQMLGRVVRLWLVIMLAPIGFIAWIIPGFGSTATRWWNTLLKSAFFAPAFLLGLYLIIRMISGGLLDGIVPGNASLTGDDDQNINAVVIILTVVSLRLGIVVGLLLGVLKIGDYFGQTSAKAVMAGAKKYGGYAATYTGARWAAGTGLKQTVGRGANAASGALANSKWANTAGTFGGWAGYRMNKYVAEPLTKKQFLGTESFKERKERVKKETTTQASNLVNIKNKEELKNAPDTFAKWTALPDKDKERMRKIAQSMSKAEMGEFKPETLAKIAHLFTQKQIDGLEKDVDDGKLTKVQFDKIKENFDGRLTNDAFGSKEAAVNQVDSNVEKVKKLEEKYLQPDGVAPSAAINRIFTADDPSNPSPKPVTMDDIDNAIRDARDRAGKAKAAYDIAVRREDDAEASKQGAIQRNAEDQHEALKKVQENAKKLWGNNGLNKNIDTIIPAASQYVPAGTLPTTPVVVPVINSFTAAPSDVIPKGSSTLTWSVTGATSVGIRPGVGNVAPIGGSARVNPETTTTYTLTATNSMGAVTRDVTVTVTTPTGPGPTSGPTSSSPSGGGPSFTIPVGPRGPATSGGPSSATTTTTFRPGSPSASVTPGAASGPATASPATTVGPTVIDMRTRGPYTPPITAGAIDTSRGTAPVTADVRPHDEQGHTISNVINLDEQRAARSTSVNARATAPLAADVRLRDEQLRQAGEARALGAEGGPVEVTIKDVSRDAARAFGRAANGGSPEIPQRGDARITSEDRDTVARAPLGQGRASGALVTGPQQPLPEYPTLGATSPVGGALSGSDRQGGRQVQEGTQREVVEGRREGRPVSPEATTRATSAPTRSGAEPAVSGPVRVEERAERISAAAPQPSATVRVQNTTAAPKNTTGTVADSGVVGGTLGKPGGSASGQTIAGNRSAPVGQIPAASQLPGRPVPRAEGVTQRTPEVPATPENRARSVGTNLTNAQRDALQQGVRPRLNTGTIEGPDMDAPSTAPQRAQAPAARGVPAQPTQSAPIPAARPVQEQNAGTSFKVAPAATVRAQNDSAVPTRTTATTTGSGVASPQNNRAQNVGTNLTSAQRSALQQGVGPRKTSSTVEGPGVIAPTSARAATTQRPRPASAPVTTSATIPGTGIVPPESPNRAAPTATTRGTTVGASRPTVTIPGTGITPPTPAPQQESAAPQTPSSAEVIPLRRQRPTAQTENSDDEDENKQKAA